MEIKIVFPQAESRVSRCDLPSACAERSSQRDKRHELRLRREQVAVTGASFLDNADRQSRECGIETLAEMCVKTGWLHAALDFK